jgi:hypothetical protein
VVIPTHNRTISEQLITRTSLLSFVDYLFIAFPHIQHSNPQTPTRRPRHPPQQSCVDIPHELVKIVSNKPSPSWPRISQFTSR